MADDGTVVVLVGMMGSGKSTVGRLLAERRGVPFCDTDEEVSRLRGATIPEIFAREGEQAFRDLESEALGTCIGRGGVIATGGGVVLRGENRVLLGAAKVAWLDASIEELAARLDGDSGRPLLGTDRHATLVELDRQRRPLYAEVASVRIEATGRTPSQICDEIVAWLELGQ